MSTSIQAAGFVISDINAVISGIGYTPDAAWDSFGDHMHSARILVVDDDADVMEEPISLSSWTRKSDYRCVVASAALLVAVNEHGGDLPWTTANGVACTDDEGRRAT